MRPLIRALVTCSFAGVVFAAAVGCGDGQANAPNAPGNAVAPGKAMKAKAGAGGSLTTPPAPPPAKKR
jgi:hypothetical protein